MCIRDRAITNPTYYWEFRTDDTSELETQSNGDIVIKDSIGNRNATIVKGSSSISTSDFSIANGLDLTSQDAYVDLGSQLLDNMMEDFSLELHLERHSSASWNRIMVFMQNKYSRHVELSEVQDYNLYTQNFNIRSYYDESTGFTPYIEAYKGSLQSQIVHIVFLYDADSNLKLYINGSNVRNRGIGNGEAISQTSSEGLNNKYWLFVDGGGNSMWPGKADYCRVWKNYLLTEDEITKLYNNRNNILKENTQSGGGSLTASNKIAVSRTNDQVEIKLPDQDEFNGTYYTSNNLTGVHSIVTLTFESSVEDLVNNYSKNDIGPYNTTLTQPPRFLTGYDKIVKIGQSVNPGEIVLEKAKVYSLFNSGAANIPAIVDIKLSTVSDGDMTKENLDKIEIKNGILITNTSQQLSIELPSQDNFLGIYHTKDNKIGIINELKITFASSVVDLVNNYGKSNIGPKNQSLHQVNDNEVIIGCLLYTSDAADE